MNWSIEYVEKGYFVNIITEGVFTGTDNLHMIEDLINRKYWKPDMNVLVDNRNRIYDAADIKYIKMSSLNFISHDMLLGCGRIAVLMKTISDFGVGREFEMLTDEQICADVRIFLDEKQCLKWLMLNTSFRTE